MDPAQGLDFHHSTLPPLRRAKSLDRRTTESVMTVRQIHLSVFSQHTCWTVIRLFHYNQPTLCVRWTAVRSSTVALLFSEVQRLKRAAAGFGMIWRTTVLEYFSQHDIKNISVYTDFSIRWRSLLSRNHSLLLFNALYRLQWCHPVSFFFFFFLMEIFIILNNHFIPCLWIAKKTFVRSGVIEFLWLSVSKCHIIEPYKAKLRLLKSFGNSFSNRFNNSWYLGKKLFALKKCILRTDSKVFS